MTTILAVSLFTLIASAALFFLSFIFTLAFDDFLAGNVFEVLMYVFAETAIAAAVVFTLITVIAFYSEVGE